MEDVINICLKSKMIKAVIKKVVKKKLKENNLKGDVDIRQVDIKLTESGDIKIDADISATLDFADLTTYIMTK